MPKIVNLGQNSNTTFEYFLKHCGKVYFSLFPWEHLLSKKESILYKTMTFVLWFFYVRTMNLLFDELLCIMYCNSSSSYLNVFVLQVKPPRKNSFWVQFGCVYATLPLDSNCVVREASSANCRLSSLTIRQVSEKRKAKASTLLKFVFFSDTTPKILWQEIQITVPFCRICQSDRLLQNLPRSKLTDKCGKLSNLT